MKTRESKELRFPANPRLVNARGERVAAFTGPLAILVDSMSGSASECFAGGMQSIGRARIFGQPSMGQALPALFDRLPNGDVLIHAYGDFVTSDGTRLEGRGVIPDEIQPLDRQELLAGAGPAARGRARLDRPGPNLGRAATSLNPGTCRVTVALATRRLLQSRTCAPKVRICSTRPCANTVFLPAIHG